MNNTHADRENKIRIAELLLRQLFTDPLVQISGLPINAVYAACKQHRLGKSVIKEARKNIGAQSELRDGVQFWFLPREDDEE